MSKTKMIAAAAALVVAVPAVAPALASADSSSTAQIVQHNWGRAIGQRARLAGYGFGGATVRCAADGGGTYTCYGKYTVSSGGVHYRYGSLIDVRGGRFNARDGVLLKQW